MANITITTKGNEVAVNGKKVATINKIEDGYTTNFENAVFDDKYGAFYETKMEAVDGAVNAIDTAIYYANEAIKEDVKAVDEAFDTLYYTDDDIVNYDAFKAAINRMQSVENILNVANLN